MSHARRPRLPKPHSTLIGATICCGVISLVVAAVVAGGDSLAKCLPSSERLYTPDRSQIKVQIKKLDAFESDMRAVLSEMKILQSTEADNKFWGELAIGRSIAGEVGRGICSGVHMVNSTLAKPCKATQEVVDVINDLKTCGEGEATGCIGAGLGAMRSLNKLKQKKYDQRVEELGGREPGATSDPRYLFNDNLQKEKGRAAVNELKGLGIEKAETLNNISKGGIDSLNELCSGVVPASGIVPGLPNVVKSGAKDGCERWPH